MPARLDKTDVPSLKIDKFNPSLTHLLTYLLTLAQPCAHSRNVLVQYQYQYNLLTDELESRRIQSLLTPFELCALSLALTRQYAIPPQPSGIHYCIHGP